MDMPQPQAAHQQLARLAGRWEGQETIAPSPFEPEGGTALGKVHNHVELGGFAVLQDYVQERGGQPCFSGHGVISVDAPSGRYRLDWIDAMGGQPATFWGELVGDVLSLQSDGPQHWSRATYTLGADSYDFAMEVSQDGEQWFPFMQATYARCV